MQVFFFFLTHPRDLLFIEFFIICLEFVFNQFYAPTTLAHPRDFYTLRYTSIFDDRNVVVSWLFIIEPFVYKENFFVSLY
mgnify:CR=1 FL=1